jgi:hypothetical protein
MRKPSAYRAISLHVRACSFMTSAVSALMRAEAACARQLSVVARRARPRMARAPAPNELSFAVQRQYQLLIALRISWCHVYPLEYFVAHSLFE